MNKYKRFTLPRGIIIAGYLPIITKRLRPKCQSFWDSTIPKFLRDFEIRMVNELVPIDISPNRGLRKRIKEQYRYQKNMARKSAIFNRFRKKL